MEQKKVSKKIKIDSDIYCTGSDQVWNSGWNGGIIEAAFS